MYQHRAVHDQLYQHLSKNQILNKWQSGFRPGYSTSTALTYVTDLLYGEIDSGHVTGIIFLDLKKAFDTVCHELLLQKLHSYGVQTTEYKWFKSYLTNRTQSVMVNNVASDELGIQYGVPQGSILGPLLFTMFINDLPRVTSKCKVVLYADDTALIYSHTQTRVVENVLNNELNHVTQWLNTNKLTLNTKKTKSMVISNKKSDTDRQIKIHVNNDKLEQVSDFKYLGVWIDDKLKFNTHISKLASKISKNIGIINKSKNYLSFKHKSMLFNALVLPHLNYCSNIWSSTNQKYTNILERLQRKAAKTILNKPKKTPTMEIYKQIHWLPTQQRWKVNRCTTVHQIIHKQVPDYLHDHFTLTKDTHTYKTRSAHNNKIKIPKYRTSTGQKSFKYQGAVDYNNIPTHLYNQTNHKLFKKKITQHILNTLW